MRRALLILAGMIVVAALVWEFIPIQKTIWDGSFELTVNVSSSAGRPRSVSCQAIGYRDEAEHTLASLLPPETAYCATVADPFTGEPIKVRVPVSGRTSPLGRELSRAQFRYLVVIGQLPDGRRVGKLVDIPDCRVSHDVTVSLP